MFKNNIKISVIGCYSHGFYSGCHGSTSLLKRFVHNDFSNYYEATQGTNIFTKNIENDGILTCYDLGSNIYSLNTYDNIFSDSFATIICVSQDKHTESNSILITQIAFLKKQYPNLLIMLAITKCDKEKSDVNIQLNLDLFGSILIASTSAKMNYNVTKLFEQIITRFKQRYLPKIPIIAVPFRQTIKRIVSPTVKRAVAIPNAYVAPAVIPIVEPLSTSVPVSVSPPQVGNLKSHQLSMLHNLISLAPHAPLITEDYQQKAERLAIAQQFKSYPQQLEFYEVFQQQFKSFYTSFKSALGGMTKNETSGNLHNAAQWCTISGQVLNFIPIVGHPLSGVMSGIAQGLDAVETQRLQNTLLAIDRLLPTNEIESFIESLARHITLRYQWQLQQLLTLEQQSFNPMVKAAQTVAQLTIRKEKKSAAYYLAELAVTLIKSALLDRTITSASNLTEQLMTILLYPAERFNERLKIEVFNTLNSYQVNTQQGLIWNLPDIFSEPDIKTEDGRCFSLTKTPSIYGIRLGTLAEVELLKDKSNLTTTLHLLANQSSSKLTLPNKPTLSLVSYQAPRPTSDTPVHNSQQEMARLQRRVAQLEKSISSNELTVSGGNSVQALMPAPVRQQDVALASTNIENEQRLQQLEWQVSVMKEQDKSLPRSAPFVNISRPSSYLISSSNPWLMLEAKVAELQSSYMGKISAQGKADYLQGLINQLKNSNDPQWRYDLLTNALKAPLVNTSRVFSTSKTETYQIIESVRKQFLYEHPEVKV